mmetsp:Transcript_79706/g.251958  ORF Transcript_79706/g.251958 Transcript_79706/m.251958 type:complete len:240 (+) Transcript_79706:217-936(+)
MASFRGFRAKSPRKTKASRESARWSSEPQDDVERVSEGAASFLRMTFMQAESYSAKLALKSVRMYLDFTPYFFETLSSTSMVCPRKLILSRRGASFSAKMRSTAILGFSPTCTFEPGCWQFTAQLPLVSWAISQSTAPSNLLRRSATTVTTRSTRSEESTMRSHSPLSISVRRSCTQGDFRRRLGHWCLLSRTSIALRDSKTLVSRGMATTMFWCDTGMCRSVRSCGGSCCRDVKRLQL